MERGATKTMKKTHLGPVSSTGEPCRLGDNALAVARPAVSGLLVDEHRLGLLDLDGECRSYGKGVHVRSG